jgi:circadian clock protein KaiC
MAEAVNASLPPSKSTGIEGLDDILFGGFPANHFYLVEGDPGAGKTTLALEFLLDGVRHGEKVLYITMSETRDELRAVGHSHGWDIEAIPVYELLPDQEALSPDSQYTVFHPSDVELAETARNVLKEVERINPDRLVLDSLAELRTLAREAVLYRRQIMGFKQFFADRACTVLLLDDRTGRGEDMQLHSLVHGVLTMEKITRDFGVARRRLEVVKMRGMGVREGSHDYVIRTGGLKVFPRLVPAEHVTDFEMTSISSGNEEMDRLLGGGIDRGTSTLLIGPAGSGKSTVALKLATSLCERGEIAAVYTFEEGPHTMLQRAKSLGLNVREHLSSGRMHLEQFDPAELSPGEFVCKVRDAVVRGTKLVVIDSLNGFLHAMPGEHNLQLQLHELLTYLNQQGVVSVIVLAQAGMIGAAMQTPVDVSYLADNIIMFRFFEAHGEVRHAISVVKKRTGRHEHSIRELRLSKDGVVVGEVLRNFHGVLTGTPILIGSSGDAAQKNGS